MTKWIKVSDKEPPQRTLVKVSGDSGYVTHERFLTLAHIDDVYRPRRRPGPPRWLGVQSDELSDQGWTPTHWAHLAPEDFPTVSKLDELVQDAQARYDALTDEQKADHDYEQKRSFVRGMCPGSRNYDEWCQMVDRILPPRKTAPR